MSPATGRTRGHAPQDDEDKKPVVVRKIARRRLDVLPRRLCCVVAVFQVKASSLIGRERCHLQSMGTQVPPRATPQQTSCWDLLPGLCSATIRGGGRIQTEELIASLPQTSSSSCPVLASPIISQLFSLFRLSLWFEMQQVDSWLSENMALHCFYIVRQPDPERKP